MEIHLRKGVGKLKFGMTFVEVEKILGQPDRTKVDPDDSDEVIWEFNDLKLRLTFYKSENDRLGYIRCSNARLKLYKHTLIDSKIGEVINDVTSITKYWEKEKYDLFATYFNEEYWLTLNVEYERVTSMELGVPFKNDEEYDWPK